jgi:DNA-binding transcriptional LysR family regulator
MIDKLQRKWDEIRESPPALTTPPVARQLLLLLLRSFRRELPDIGSDQEVHHRLIALLHGEQLRDLQVSASARSPSSCFPHLFPERFLLASPSAAVAEQVLSRLGHCPTSAAAPPAFVVVSVSEPF